MNKKTIRDLNKILSNRLNSINDEHRKIEELKSVIKACDNNIFPSNYSFKASSYNDNAKLITHEKNSLIVSSGNKSRLIAHGNESWLIALGEDSLVIAMGLNCKVVLAKGCKAVLCWFDGENTRPLIIREGEGMIKAFVPYYLDENGFPQEYP